MKALTEKDIDNRMEGWNTVGRLPGCETDWDGSQTPSPAHVSDCKCPPYRCEDCGLTQSQREPCGCFTTFDGMAFADIRALLVSDEDGLDLNMTTKRKEN